MPPVVPRIVNIPPGAFIVVRIQSPYVFADCVDSAKLFLEQCYLELSYVFADCVDSVKLF